MTENCYRRIDQQQIFAVKGQRRLFYDNSYTVIISYIILSVDGEQVRKIGSSLTAIANEKSKAQKVCKHGWQHFLNFHQLW